MPIKRVRVTRCLPTVSHQFVCILTRSYLLGNEPSSVPDAGQRKWAIRYSWTGMNTLRCVSTNSRCRLLKWVTFTSRCATFEYHKSFYSFPSSRVPLEVDWWVNASVAGKACRLVDQNLDQSGAAHHGSVQMHAKDLFAPRPNA